MHSLMAVAASPHERGKRQLQQNSKLHTIKIWVGHQKAAPFLNWQRVPHTNLVRMSTV